MRSNEAHLIVFAKAPFPGQVKTRLIPSLGAQGAAVLYERLILHCVATACESGVGSVSLWCTPSTEHRLFRFCAERFKIGLRTQAEGDLGRRMADALSFSLKAVTHALLIGTDCPSITSYDLREAATALREDREAVIGPTEDGGYGLIGLKRVVIDLFEGISWGGENVLEETRNRLLALRWRWHELPVRWDVDRPEDLEHLKKENYVHLLKGIM